MGAHGVGDGLRLGFERIRSRRYGGLGWSVADLAQHLDVGGGRSLMAQALTQSRVLVNYGLLVLFPPGSETGTATALRGSSSCRTTRARSGACAARSATRCAARVVTSRRPSIALPAPRTIC